MATVKKGTDKGDENPIHRIRISLSSRNPKALEKVCTELMGRVQQEGIKAKGPVRLPTRSLKLTVRKSPCGNGTNTWDHYTMKIYKRLIDLYSPQEVVKQITSIQIEPGVDVEVSVTEPDAKK